MLQAAAALALARAVAAGATPAEEAAAQREIRALELEQNTAIARADVATLDRLTRADFTYVTPRGFLVSKPAMLRALAEGQFGYEYREISDLSIRLYGDSAIVTGRSVSTVQHNGRDVSDAVRYLRVYVRQQGHWLAVAWQMTPETYYRPDGRH